MAPYAHIDDSTAFPQTLQTSRVKSADEVTAGLVGSLGLAFTLVSAKVLAGFAVSYAVVARRP